MKILAVMSHPDDAEVWCGGTLAKYTAWGHRGHIVVMTYAAGDLRGQEALQGAGILGCSIDLLGYRDSHLRDTDEAADRLVQILVREAPQVLVVHNADETHPDHEASLRIALRSVLRWYDGPYRPPAIPSIFSANTYRGMGLRGPVVLDTFVDISAVWETKARALEAHRSQGATEWIPRLRTTLEALGSRAGYAVAEGFRRLVPFSEPGAVPHLDPALIGDIPGPMRERSG
jgi:LmbE family N-acetylglucosaminyl deacetylase